MKVFSIIMEDCNNKEITTIREYVTGKSLGKVAEHFQAYADSLNYELIEVRYILTTVENVGD